jgi:hypothetical protein
VGKSYYALPSDIRAPYPILYQILSLRKALETQQRWQPACRRQGLESDLIASTVSAPVRAKE